MGARVTEEEAKRFESLKKQVADQQTDLITLRFLLECATAAQFHQGGDGLRRARESEQELLKQVATLIDPDIPPAAREYLNKSISELMMRFFQGVREKLGEKPAAH